MTKYFREDDHGYKAMLSALESRTVNDHFWEFLSHRGVRVPKEVLERDVRERIVPNAEVQRGLLGLYKTQPDLGILFERMTDFDEGIQEWRYRHVKLVERTIGAKKGTGGSLGVEFLKKSLFLPAFPDLWAIRHEL
jgi:tryptophan 2,3-dioxygenase